QARWPTRTTTIGGLRSCGVILTSGPNRSLSTSAGVSGRVRMLAAVVIAAPPYTSRRIPLSASSGVSPGRSGASVVRRLASRGETSVDASRTLARLRDDALEIAIADFGIERTAKDVSLRLRHQGVDVPDSVGGT